MSIKNFLLDLFFPKKCFGCETYDTWLCKKCLAKITLYDGEIPRALSNTRDLIIAGKYQDKVLNALITAFKFGFNQELSLPLFIFLKKAIDQKILINNLSGNYLTDIIVVPIPLHASRKKWRGFNQSELIAQEISSYYNWPLVLDLSKIKKTKIQAELKEEARLHNISGAFKWTGADLENKTVLLIDDVITSGATTYEAEKTLQAAKCRRVIKVALAKG